MGEYQKPDVVDRLNREVVMNRSRFMNMLLSGLIAATLHAGSHEPPPDRAATGPAHTPATTAAKNPNDVLSDLMRGNRRFVNGSCLYSNQDQKRRAETAKNGQTPVATILTCSDSRVPPEIIFDQGIGDLFVVRIAGNTAGRSETGSIEYGIGHLGTPLLMVLGHTKCGAVTAAVKGTEVHGSIVHLISRIEPAARKVRAGRKDLPEDDLLLTTIKANVFQAIEDIFTSSAEVRMLVRRGKLKVIGALYDIETGAVSDLGVHYRQEALVRGKGK